jgi:xylan 1,4-beta-xylosidase
MEFRIRRDAKRFPHKKHWQFCVGSGHALLALRTDYTEQLKFIHDTLGIGRVRFHGIFCDDMRTCNDLSMQMDIEGAEQFTEYNFNACALAYDNVLAAGMKPFVELSFMPEKLALKEEGRPLKGGFFYRPNIVPPADYAAWREYIQAFIRFLRKRYGEEEVRGLYFEVWNEPDLPYIFWNGSREEYFRFYAETARAIKDIDPEIRVGGPSSSGSKWISSFLAYCAGNGVPVDFVSTHQYAGDPLGGVEDQGGEEGQTGGFEAWQAHLRAAAEALKHTPEKTFLAGYRAVTPDKSETQELPDDLFRKNAARAREQAGGKPLFYTEWNENAIFSAYTNDTRKVAAYDVKMALAVAEDVSGSSIWCFSDVFEELHPFPQEFHGGFGMLSQHGIPKPVYYAMKLLADAPDTRIDLGGEAPDGEIGAAAFTDGRETHVVLFRQKMKNLDLPAEEAVIRIEMPEKPASVTVKRIDETHGNPLRIWEAMGSPETLTPAETEKIREESAVHAEDWPYEWADGVLTIRAALGVNDVYGFVVY